MKNTLKFLGIIAIVAVIGFSMSCQNWVQDYLRLQLTNQNDLPITGMSTCEAFTNRPYDLNITKGNSQTFTSNTDNWRSDSGDIPIAVTVYFGENQEVSKIFRFTAGQTTTVTFTAAGTLE